MERNNTKLLAGESGTIRDSPGNEGGAWNNTGYAPLSPLSLSASHPLSPLSYARAFTSLHCLSHKSMYLESRNHVSARGHGILGARVHTSLHRLSHQMNTYWSYMGKISCLRTKFPLGSCEFLHPSSRVCSPTFHSPPYRAGPLYVVFF